MLTTILASSDTTVVEEVADGAAETAESVADTAIDQLESFSELFSILKFDNLINIGVRLLVIILVLTLSYRVIKYLLNRAYETRRHHGNVTESNIKQLKTARHMVQSIIFYSFILIGLIAVMSIFGFDMRGLATSAGIAGAALVLISQNIILDWISGVFILVERQFNVGDYVKLGDYTGEVQTISIRQTVLKTDFNETVTIPNGTIKVVVNYTKDPVTEYFDIRIHDASRLDEGKRALEAVCVQMNHRFDEMLTSPCRVMGVQEIIGTGLTMRLTFQSNKGDTYPILRALREECTRALTAIGLQQQLS